MKIKKLYEDSIIPTRGSAEAAGWDLYSYTNEIIQPHETKKIDTGIAIEIPNGFFGGIYARSGLATKEGLAPANKCGIIDSDYRGPIIVALHNHSTEPRRIEYGERIAQLIIQPYLFVDLEVVNTLEDTERGTGGFGHTGK